MKRQWIFISLSVIFFLTALTFYVNRIVFPVVVKKIAIKQAENFLQRKVEIGSIHFNWVRGFVIDKIKIYQKNSNRDVLAQAEKISFGVIFIPGLHQHHLTLPFVRIQAPSFHFIHQTNDQWNFSDLIPLAAATGNSKKPSPVAIMVGGMTLTDGKLRLDDLEPQGTSSELFDQINLKAGLSYQGITFDGSFLIPDKKGFVSLQGSYQPLNQSLKAQMTLKNIKPADYLSLVPFQLPLTLASGTINELKAQVDYTPDKISLQGDWSIKNIDVTVAKHNIKADMDLKNANIRLQNNTVDIQGQCSLANAQILTPTFSIAGQIKADVADLLIHSPEDITLKALVQADKLVVKLPDQSFQGQLSANITQARWHKDSASFEGDMVANQALIVLGDDQNIKGNLMLNNITVNKNNNQTTIHTDLNLNGLELRLPGEIFKGNLHAHDLNISLDNQNNIKLNGPLDLNNIDAVLEKTRARGSLHISSLTAVFDQNQQTLDVQTQGTWQEVHISLDQEKSLTGNVHFDIHAFYPLNNPARLQYDGSLSVEGARLEGLPSEPFKDISGTVKADGHSFHITVSSKNIKLKAEVHKNGNTVEIKDISGHYLSAVFHLNGAVDLSTRTPGLDIESDLKFKLEDLPTLLPDLKKALDPLRPSGLISVNSSIKGPGWDWKNWTSNTSAQSDVVSLAGLKFNSPNIKVRQDEGKIKEFNITSGFYGGNLNMITSVNLTDSAMPFESAFHVENVDLAKLKDDIGARDEDLRGLMALTMVANGTLKDILNIKGKGAFNIAQGYLMKKELSSLFIIPELSNFIFTDASANFTVGDQKVATDNFVLKSEGADLNGKGWVDFDHHLNFELSPQFNSDKIAESLSFKKGPSALIASAVDKYLTIHIGGTLEKPLVRTVKKPSEIIKKTGQMIKENVKEILKGIFQ
ncbi:MAG: DUF748 domain-containing protein [Candidatus Omnitrophica bacterium]|nr:DUF748 domain-containing protein [Candidatus Omnitrophota bacterium]